MTADARLQALLELERRGALTPPAAQMLSAYRAQGVSKTKPIGPGSQPGGLPQAPTPSGDMFEKDTSRDASRAALDLIDRVQPRLNRVRDLYEKTLKGAGPVQSLREYLPSQSNSQFDAAAGQLQALVRPATRTKGEGAMSDFESKLAMQMVPTRYNFDAQNEESIGGLQEFLDSNRKAYAKRMGLPTAPPSVSAVKSAAREITLDRNGNVVR